MSTPASTFACAARAFADLVAKIPDDGWDGPGLGEWDLRSLVGHTSRALITVATYSKVPADHEDLPDAQSYYAQLQAAMPAADPAAILERGRHAGLALGDRPSEAIDALATEVIGCVDTAEDGLIQVIGGLGIRLYAYLPTRTFELAVHSLDIAAATNVPFALPDEVLAEALTLAALIAAETGTGTTLLSALTGRSALPEHFSVV
jgi:uncharacterized protein (TIGR03083 family)